MTVSSTGVAQGIGNSHVVFFLELDSLITAPCLHRSASWRSVTPSSSTRSRRSTPTRTCSCTSTAAPPMPSTPGEWRVSCVAPASGTRRGFFLNSTHFDWTTTEVHYGQEISRMLGGVHFIVNTGSNGRGPLRPRDPRPPRQRGAVQPARPRPRTAQRQQRHRAADQLPRCRRLALVLKPRRQRRRVSARRSSDGRLLARARGDARAQLGRPRRRAAIRARGVRVRPGRTQALGLRHPPIRAGNPPSAGWE